MAARSVGRLRLACSAVLRVQVVVPSAGMWIECRRRGVVGRGDHASEGVGASDWGAMDLGASRRKWRTSTLARGDEQGASGASIAAMHGARAGCCRCWGARPVTTADVTGYGGYGGGMGGMGMGSGGMGG